MKLFESDRNNRIFSEVANKLLTECFLIKKRETDDYLFVIQNREKFSDFFSTIGYAVNIYEHNNVIRVSVKLATEKIFPKYLDNELFELREKVNEAIEELISKGWIVAKRS